MNSPSQDAASSEKGNPNSSKNNNLLEISDAQFCDTLDALLEYEGLHQAGDEFMGGAEETETADGNNLFTLEKQQPPLESAVQNNSLNTKRQSQPQSPQQPSVSDLSEFPLPLPPGKALATVTASLKTSSNNNTTTRTPRTNNRSKLSKTAQSIVTTTTTTTTTTNTVVASSKKRSLQEISEDEGELEKRRCGRNMREQKRSQHISSQIERLRQVLTDANVNFKTDRLSTLSAVVEYVKRLQERATVLDCEHRKLLESVVKTSELTTNQYMPVTANSGPVLLPSSAASVTSESVVSDNTTSTTTNDRQGPPDLEGYEQGIDYKSIFMSCPFACSLTRIDGRFIDCNQEFVDCCKFSRQELLRSDTRGGDNDDNDTTRTNHLPMSVDKQSASDEPSTMSSSSSSSSVGSNLSTVRNLSLFNVLKKEDMERVYVAMSDMLKRGSAGHRIQVCDSDSWIESVSFCREPEGSEKVRLCVSLVRTSQGIPQFFNCAILPS